MLVKEIKKIATYTIFLAILLFPMLGFPTKEFQASRPLIVMLVLLGLLVLNLVVKYVKRNQDKTVEKPTWTEVIADRLSQYPRWMTLGSVLLVAFLFPVFANNYMIDVGITCLIYVCLGMGLNIVVGLCGLLDLGFIAFYAVGAYTYSLLNLTFGLDFWACLPLGIILGMTCGCIIGYPTLKMRGDYLAIVTMGFGEIIRIILNNWTELTAGPNGLFGQAAPMGVNVALGGRDGYGISLGELTNLPSMYYLILVLAILTVIGVSRLNDSRIGRAWIAIREDETAAELSGVPTTAVKLLAYALGAGFASVAGSFFAAKLSYTNPNFFLFMESCIVLCIVVLGGVGSIPGIIIAAIVLIAVPEVFRELESYRMLAFGAIMTTMMVLKPEGLIPAARKRRELHEREAVAGEDA